MQFSSHLLIVCVLLHEYFLFLIYTTIQHFSFKNFPLSLYWFCSCFVVFYIFFIFTVLSFISAVEWLDDVGGYVNNIKTKKGKLQQNQNSYVCMCKKNISQNFPAVF